MTWFDIPTEHRADDRRCASHGCGKEPIARFEAGGVGSDYCAECVAKIDAMIAAAVAAEREACAKLADRKAADDRRRGAILAKVVADEDEEDILQSYEDFAITAEAIATAIRKRSKPV